MREYYLWMPDVRYRRPEPVSHAMHCDCARCKQTRQVLAQVRAQFNPISDERTRLIRSGLVKPQFTGPTLSQRQPRKSGGDTRSINLEPLGSREAKDLIQEAE
jgi:hypothetical protein